MILTETLFRKIISFAVPRETQFHTDLMAQASTVLKGAHKRGVELEYILEVRPSSSARSGCMADPAGEMSSFLRFVSYDPETSQTGHHMLCVPLVFPVYI